MEDRKMVKETISTLNFDNFGTWVIKFLAGISKHVEAKHVLNMVITEGETKDETNKLIVDFGDTNDLVYSLLMEACFKHPEAMLVAANYTKGWANELVTILKKRFGRVDRQVTQVLVREFHNTEMLLGESGAKFVIELNLL